MSAQFPRYCFYFDGSTPEKSKEEGCVFQEMGPFEVLIVAGKKALITLDSWSVENGQFITIAKDQFDKAIVISFVSLDNENIPR